MKKQQQLKTEQQCMHISKVAIKAYRSVHSARSCKWEGLWESPQESPLGGSNQPIKQCFSL